MATVAVTHMSPAMVGPQRKIYSGEATDSAIFELVYFDKPKKQAVAAPVDIRLRGRELEPFVGAEFATPLAKTVPAANKKMSDTKSTKSKFEKKTAEAKAAKAEQRLIAATRPSPASLKPAVAGSTSTASAPAPHCLPLPPKSLLF